MEKKCVTLFSITPLYVDGNVKITKMITGLSAGIYQQWKKAEQGDSVIIKPQIINHSISVLSVVKSYKKGACFSGSAA